MSAKDKPHSKHATDAYRNNHELIWGKKEWSKAVDKVIEETQINGSADQLNDERLPAGN